MHNILVTGATRGIGRAIVEELKSLGKVYGCGRNDELLKAAMLEDYCVCDLQKPEILKEFIEKNKIDVLVNNAGEYIYGGIEEMSKEQIDEIVKVNSIAPAYLSSCVVPYMKKNKWGRIINIGSISGVMGEANASLYSLTKASLIGFTKALALEVASDNITVNTINPGWVDTDLGMESIDESDFSRDEIVECVPQRRFVEPCEVAHLVKYLAGDDAKGITGQSINLCAGLSVGY